MIYINETNTTTKPLRGAIARIIAVTAHASASEAQTVINICPRSARSRHAIENTHTHTQTRAQLDQDRRVCASDYFRYVRIFVVYLSCVESDLAKSHIYYSSLSHMQIIKLYVVHVDRAHTHTHTLSMMNVCGGFVFILEYYLNVI